MRDQLAALPTSGDVLTVEDLGETRWVTAGVRGKPLFRERYDLGDPAADWEVTWKAADPLKYGRTRTVTVPAGGAVEVEHLGTADAWPVLRLVGPLSALEVRAGGRAVRVSRSIPAGGWVEVDTRRAWAVDQAGVSIGTDLRGRMPLIPSGGGPVYFDATGSGRLELTVTDTYY
ncbi:hypothetical protein FM112_07870 [Gulosibacter sp. 10]|nr:hypothetical protein FM112_07870 [Gulosibacter sp. 10]